MKVLLVLVVVYASVFSLGYGGVIIHYLVN